jgi:hypothetical protein
MTPLGDLVDPEVYWIKAMSSASMSGATHSAASAPG